MLDVGDTTGYLSIFDPDLRSVGLDLVLAPDHLAGVRRIVGDGCRLPFADRSFDAVVSADTLEHVPQEQREVFLLRANGELSFEEIAAATEASLGTVKSRMRLAVARLKLTLGGLTSDAEGGAQ